MKREAYVREIVKICVISLVVLLVGSVSSGAQESSAPTSAPALTEGEEAIVLNFEASSFILRSFGQTDRTGQTQNPECSENKTMRMSESVGPNKQAR